MIHECTRRMDNFKKVLANINILFGQINIELIFIIGQLKYFHEYIFSNVSKSVNNQISVILFIFQC